MSPPSPSLSSKQSGSPRLGNQKPTRSLPPRLQHSPSLPNIWFPPHSGPLPTKLDKMPRDDLHLSCDPDSFAKQLSQHAQSNTEKHVKPKPSLVCFREKPQANYPHVKLDTHKLPRRRQQRVENESHKLLTPPLTPSSSIRTTASSVDSSVGPCDSSSSGDHKLETTDIRGDDATGPSRFLRVDNISPDVPQEVVTHAISTSITTIDLARYRADNSLPTPITPSTKDDLQSGRTRLLGNLNPILGHKLNSGSLFLAFHDLREAVAAKKYFDTRENDVFDSCVDLTKDGTGRQRLTCRFLTMDQVTDELGPSNFIRSMDASFKLRVEPDIPAGSVTKSVEELDELEHVDKTKQSDLIQTYLETFGDILVFSETTVQDERPNPEYKTFHVEFFDRRDTNAAYEALDGMILFGMKIKVSGREDIVKAKDQAESEIMQARTSDQPAIVPFPISRAYDDYVPQFGPPGQFSQTRQPFPINGPLVDDTLQSAPSISSTESRGSPPVFYSSVDHDAGNSGKHPNEGIALDQHRAAQIYYHGPAYPTFNGTPSPGPVIPYFAQTPTLPSISVHPGYLSPPPPPHFSCHGPIHTLPGNAIPFEHDAMFQQMNMPWPIEMMNGIAPYPPSFPVNASPVLGQDPYCWVQGATPRGFAANNASYFAPGAPGVVSPLANDQSSSPSVQVASSVRADSVHSDKSVPPPTTHLVRNSRTNVGKKDLAESNQLNIRKIEIGEDGRTTVMIKNIPNKMSDKDLIQYIAEVTPRKIDFLYLRMDFKNGCNVGYAFVNFISVQDLLSFAKARLGQKWNMFSSEKVLQMSYAVYQGKESLVDKFKNSCIMDEREAWQPKIFYSEPGPMQGLRQPFPAPTHQRRKERSSNNKGALFVPGNQNHNTLNFNNPFNGPSKRGELHTNNGHHHNVRSHRRPRPSFAVE
ncbi:RNA recognition motif 2-domain-containing protein [Lentinula raphanica]|nr:RNA recognition motif 2-domain-containing protein [Lentinula raphanica]